MIAYLPVRLGPNSVFAMSHRGFVTCPKFESESEHSHVASTWFGIPMHLNYGVEDIVGIISKVASSYDRAGRWGSALLGELIGQKLGLDFYMAFRKFSRA